MPTAAAARPVSEHQRAFFQHRLEEALRLFGWRRQAYLDEHGWNLDYLYQMAKVEPAPIAPMRHREPPPQEAEAMLADLQARVRTLETPGLRQWREHRRASRLAS